MTMCVDRTSLINKIMYAVHHVIFVFNEFIYIIIRLCVSKDDRRPMVCVFMNNS